MTRAISLLILALALTACAGHTPPTACRGDVFALNSQQEVSR
ncbi:hypothetical protein RMP42_05977 [Roseomonas mucosa]|nr:hypothetical protein RMP42_05977 [Roseomonas mucosa]